jgi:carboxymethylenebutenolidase
MANIATTTVQFSGAGRVASGFLASPQEAVSHPGLIVLQEFWGLNDHIRDVTRRLAAEGFVALAPDMYDGKVTTDPAEARQLLQSMDQSAALQKLNGAVDYLKSQPRVEASRIGVIGFCMGGFLALNLACHNRDVRVATPFYGRIPPDTVLENLSAPVLYFFGEQDHHLPAADVDRLEQFLKRTGRTGAVVRYPEADHAFFNDTRKEVYREEDAKDAWRKALAFLRKYLQDTEAFPR